MQIRIARSHPGKAVFILLFGVSTVMPAVAEASLWVTSPNGGEVWSSGDLVEITWWDINTSAEAEVSLYRNGEFVVQIGSAPASARSLSWRVCECLGDGADYTVRVACDTCAQPEEDFSDAPFTITGTAPVPTITLTAPIGGETWVPGQTATVTWTASDPTGWAAIWLLNNGQPHEYLGKTRLSAGRFDYSVCPYIESGSDYSVHVAWLDSANAVALDAVPVAPLKPHCGPIVEDVSAACFTITGSLPLPGFSITSPSAGDVWPADTTQTIVWHVDDPSGYVDLWLRYGDFGSRYIGTAPAAAGRFDWSMPPCTPAGTDNHVYAQWSACDRAVEAVSDGTFEISPAQAVNLKLVNTDDYDDWDPGSTQTIEWNCSSQTAEVDVYLYRNQRFYQHLGRVPASQGGMQWTICPSLEYASYSIVVSMVGCSAQHKASLGTLGSSGAYLTLTSPTGNEQWPAGSVQRITWNTNICGQVSIYLPDEQHPGWKRVTAPAADGEYLWHIARTLPADSSQTIELRITAYSAKQDVWITNPVTVAGDFDSDGDVDLFDLAILQTCSSDRGPLLLARPCDALDVEPDADVDVDDFVSIRENLTGPLGEVNLVRSRSINLADYNDADDSSEHSVPQNGAHRDTVSPDIDFIRQTHGVGKGGQ